MSIGGFLGIVGIMFLLELPDKTMIATVVMSARARPLSVALGAVLAFTDLGYDVRRAPARI